MAPRKKRTLVQGGTVITPQGARAADVLVDGDRIIGIGPSIAPRRGDLIVDATDHAVIPGLVQARTHLVTSSMRGIARGYDRATAMREHVWPAEMALDAAAVKAAATSGAIELLHAGVTSILDAGTSKHVGEIFRAASELGLRATIGRAFLDRGQGLPPKLRDPASQALGDIAALIDRWHGADDGRLRVALAPRGATSCSPALLLELAALSAAHDLRIALPYAESQSEVAAAREMHEGEPIAPLASKRLVVAHGTWLTSEAQRLLRESGAHVVHCPTADLALGSGTAKVPEMIRAGVSLSVSVGDAPATYLLDPWAEMRLAAMLPGPRHGAIPPADVFAWATIGGARALGLADEIGTIELGKKADLAVVRLRHDGDPITALVLGASSSDVSYVLIDGILRIKKRALPARPSPAR